MAFTRLLLLFLTVSVYAVDLPTLQTKQELNNLRYLSRDGKISIYRKYSGSLELATNYATQER
jgi:hypothetical protein